MGKKLFSCLEGMTNEEIVFLLIYRDKLLHDLGLRGYPLEGWYYEFIKNINGGNKHE